MTAVRRVYDPSNPECAKDGYQVKACRQCEQSFKTNAFWRIVCYDCQPDWFYVNGHGPAPSKFSKR